jgi:hypothetical protein
MIAPFVYQSSAKVNVSPMALQSTGLSRMFAAAVVNQQFCEMLLNNPQEALRKGYLGETFTLTKDECDLIVSIRARSLADLARALSRSLISS